MSKDTVARRRRHACPESEAYRELVGTTGKSVGLVGAQLRNLIGELAAVRRELAGYWTRVDETTSGLLRTNLRLEKLQAGIEAFAVAFRCDARRIIAGARKSTAQH